MADNQPKATLDLQRPYQVIEREGRFFVESAHMDPTIYGQMALSMRSTDEATGMVIVFGLPQRQWAEMLAETMNTVVLLQYADTDRKAGAGGNGF